MVVELNSSVQLRPTVSISGVLADENRRVAVRRFADARKPPTGEIRASGGPRTAAARRATIGPRKPTAATRKSAVISDVAAATSGALVVVATANSGTAQASINSPPIRRPGPSSRGSTAASVSACVGGTRAARRPAREDGEQRRQDSAGDGRGDRQPAGADDEVRGRDAVVHEPLRELAAEDGPGPDARGRADQADDRGLPRDHAADLTRRRGNRSQERDLALALLDGQAHRAGHDEDRDEQRHSAERRGDGDQLGPRLQELGILGPAALVAGEHLRAAGGGAQARGVEARRGEHPDRVDPSGMTGQARRFAVGEEDRRLAPHEVARPGDADHGDAARGFGGRQAQLLAERGGIAGDDLVGPGGRASRAQHVRRQRGAAPPVGDGVPAAEAGRHRDVGDRLAARRGRPPAGRRAKTSTRARSPSTTASSVPTTCCPVTTAAAPA